MLFSRYNSRRFLMPSNSFRTDSTASLFPTLSFSSVRRVSFARNRFSFLGEGVSKTWLTYSEWGWRRGEVIDS